MQDLRQFRNQQTYHKAFWTLLESKPYGKITVSDFPAVCGLNRKTFYSYYADVEALAKACVHELFVNILNVNVQDNANWDATYNLFQNILQYKKEIALVSERGLDALVYDELRNRMQNLEDAVMPEGMEYAKDLLHDYSVAISWRCIMWGCTHADWTPEELTRVSLETYRTYITFMASQYKSGGIR